jgi:hypothetical protein
MEFALLALGLSLALNVYFAINQKKNPKKLAVDAKQLLHDLTQGGAIVKVTVIDPDGLMIYRGRA